MTQAEAFVGKLMYTFKMKSEEDLYPHFGYCNHLKREIRLRNDLPLSMFKFVLAYNVLHIGFDYTNASKLAVIHEELTALLGAMISHPIGGIRTIFSILRWGRIKLWLTKFWTRN